MNVSRTELHALVWSMQSYKVAELFLMSGTGLTKLCRRFNVPVPGRGYWNKVSAGKRVKKIELPNPEDPLAYRVKEAAERQLLLALQDIPEPGGCLPDLPRDIRSGHGSEKSAEKDNSESKRRPGRLKSHAELEVYVASQTKTDSKKTILPVVEFEGSRRRHTKEFSNEVGDQTSDTDGFASPAGLSDMMSRYESLCAVNRLIAAAELKSVELPAPAAELLRLWISAARDYSRMIDPIAVLSKRCLEQSVQASFGPQPK